MDTEKALREAVPLKTLLVKAYRGKDYDEVKLKSVEDGIVAPWQVPSEHYPLRIPRQPESYIELLEAAGHTVRHTAEWDLAFGPDGYFVVAIIEEMTVKLYPAEGCTVEGPHMSFTLSQGGTLS